MSEVGIGATLADARTEQGRTVAEAAAATSMRVVQVEAIEADRFEVFGGDVYAKGFVRSYANWLGLDPEPLLDRYRRYVQHDAMDPLALTAGPVNPRERSEIPAWLLRVTAVVAVLGTVVGLVSLVQSRTPDNVDVAEQAGDAPEPVAPSPTPTPTERPSEAAPSPTPTPIEGIELTLTFEDASWVSVSVDGQPLQEGLFNSGDVLDLTGEEEVTVRLGNAGGVTGLYNGQTVGPFGASGDVREIRFTVHGFEEV